MKQNKTKNSKDIIDNDTLQLTKLLNDKSNILDKHLLKTRPDSGRCSEKDFNIKVNNTRNEKEKLLQKKRSVN